mgnify:CR=1 FL=1
MVFMFSILLLFIIIFRSKSNNNVYLERSRASCCYKYPQLCDEAAEMCDPEPY